MSFLFPLGEIVPPATANAPFPEQTAASFHTAENLEGNKTFPQLLAALSELDIRSLSPDSAAGVSSSSVELASFPESSERPTLPGEHNCGERRAASICEQTVASPSLIHSWSNSSDWRESGSGSPPILPTHPDERERGEEEENSESNRPDFPFVTFPAGFSPVAAASGALPVLPSLFGEPWTFQKDPNESEGLQDATPNPPPLAVEPESAIPGKDGGEDSVKEERLQRLPGLDGHLPVPPINPGSAESLPGGRIPQQNPTSSPPVDLRHLTGDRRQPASAGTLIESPVSARGGSQPVDREAFRLLLRGNAVLPQEYVSAVAPPLSTTATRQTATPEADARDWEDTVHLPRPSPLRESTADNRSSEMGTAVGRQRVVPDASITHEPMSSAKPAASHDSSAGVRGLEPVAQLGPGRDAQNGHSREDEQANNSRPKNDTNGKPVMSREHAALLTNSRPAAEQSGGKAETASVAAATSTDEPTRVLSNQNTVRQLRVSLQPSAAGGGVELLVQQRPGGVEVSVHSPDREVRDTLRSGLSELIGTLHRKGVAAEALPSFPAAQSTREIMTPAGLNERGEPAGIAASTEVPEGERGEDPQSRQQRQPQWESGGENRRRREPDADAWKKYLEEYAWRNQ